MGDLAENLRRRVRVARWNVEQARRDGDGFGVDVFSAELEDLLRRADAHRVSVDTDLADTDLADTGLAGGVLSGGGDG